MKTTDPEMLLLGLTVLLFKHMIADFFLQTKYQYSNKGFYLHPGGLLHAAIHAVLTTCVFAVLPARSLQIGALVLLAEFLVHYHIDLTKEKIVRRFGWTPTTNAFWWAIGVDQFLHNLTYIGIVWYLARGQFW